MKNKHLNDNTIEFEITDADKLENGCASLQDSDDDEHQKVSDLESEDAELSEFDDDDWFFQQVLFHPQYFFVRPYWLLKFILTFASLYLFLTEKWKRQQWQGKLYYYLYSC